MILEKKKEKPGGFDELSFFILVAEECIIERVVDFARDLLELCVNVTRTGSIFAALQSRTELADRAQEIDIVAADKVLRQTNDRAGHRLLAVMVRRHRRHQRCQLRHLFFLSLFSMVFFLFLFKT